MRNLLAILALLLVLTSSCTSQSERVAKYKNRPVTVVLLKVAFSTVIDYEERVGVLQYYESDTTLVTLAGNMYLADDSVRITRITTFRRARR